GLCSLLCFFFQAEDGIRDFHVTGVQTCALPILTITENDNNVIEDLTFANVEVIAERLMTAFTEGVYDRIVLVYNSFRNAATQVRSEERRVGKERRSRLWAEQLKSTETVAAWSKT